MELDSAGSPCWAFPLSELSPRSEWQKVGEGSFGNVYRAALLGTPVAVKEAANFKESRLDGIRRDVLYLRRGGSAWARSACAVHNCGEAHSAADTHPRTRARSTHPHPNIVQILGAWESRDGKLFVAMGAPRVGRFGVRAPA
jgi:serine/threonine-protein kinase 24/25/MST4